MYIIQEILVQDDILSKKFACDVSVCKGACCWKGDFGAPISEMEMKTWATHKEEIIALLDEESTQIVQEKGLYSYFKGMDDYGVNLKENGACVLMGKNEDGIAFCKLEKASKDGAIQVDKPISCALYPIRATHKPEIDFSALNYDEWDICSPALKKGEQQNISLLDFCANSLSKAYGEDFLEAIRDAQTHFGD